MLEIMVDLLGMVLRTLLWMLLWFLFFLFVVLLPLIFEKWSVASLATPVSYQLFWLIHAYLSLLFAGMDSAVFVCSASPRRAKLAFASRRVRFVGAAWTLLGG
jgi:hypothetical protein